MLQTRDRGAGVITVVAVLAIAGILLSGSLMLAHMHVQNVTKTEMNVEEMQELDVCAEMICYSLTHPNGGSYHTLADLYAPEEDAFGLPIPSYERGVPSALQLFYETENEDGKKIGLNYEEDVLYIRTELGLLSVSASSFPSTVEITLIHQTRQVLITAEYRIQAVDGVYRYERLSVTETEATV